MTSKTILVSGALLVSLGCDPGPLPPVAKPGALVETVRLEVPGCDLSIPPFRDRHRHAGEILRYIKPDDLCDMAKGLKRWMDNLPSSPPDFEPGDWDRIGFLEFYRMPDPQYPLASKVFESHLYANVLERPRLFGVARSESGSLKFFIVHK